jgi:SnoaL-like domain
LTGIKRDTDLVDDALDGLLSEQAIRRVIQRYARGIDRLDLDLVRGCYWPDATDDHGPFSGTRDDFIDWVSSLLNRHTMTMHLLNDPLVEQHADDATAETYGVAYHCGEPPGDPRWNNVAGFRYVDRFARRDDEWRIAARITVVEWVTPWDRDPDLTGKFGGLARRDRTDPVYQAGVSQPPT